MIITNDQGWTKREYVCMCVVGRGNKREVVGRRELVGVDGEEEMIPVLECTPLQVQVRSGVTGISEGVGEV